MFKLLAPAAGLLAAVLLLAEVLRSMANWVRTAQAERVQDYLYGLIHSRAISLDLAFYETPEYYDQLHRARIDALTRPTALLESMGNLTQNGLTLAVMASVLITYAWWLPLALLFSTLPALAVVGRFTWRFHEWRLQNTLNERRLRYYDWLLTWDKAAAELRLFDLGWHFRGLFQQLRGRLREGRLQLARSQLGSEIAASIFGLLVTGAVMVWMAWRVLRKLSSLGDLALFFQVFSQGHRIASALLNNTVEIYSNILFLENLFEFLALKPQIIDPLIPVKPWIGLRQEIRIQEVTFRYPGSQRVALENFNLTIPAGQIVAIVGENGAGKSTLIKLLCRFYDPEAGQILFDGIDMRSLSIADLRRQITVLFQEPAHYFETVARNIEVGDLSATVEPDELKAVARAAGAELPISRLPNGYDTLLGKQFGGAELSVGEWQRVALARAFLRKASFIILDEPTSAMDAWAEADWMSRFRARVAGRTALIITHRFTTALKADIIHVMDQGRIVESGSHGELLSMNGRYAQSWWQQTYTASVSELPAHVALSGERLDDSR
jgi:ATP-binding cassette subfamily B protein